MVIVELKSNFLSLKIPAVGIMEICELVWALAG